jgi:peroxiredoxin
MSNFRYWRNAAIAAVLIALAGCAQEPAKEAAKPPAEGQPAAKTDESQPVNKKRVRIKTMPKEAPPGSETPESPPAKAAEPVKPEPPPPPPTIPTVKLSQADLDASILKVGDILPDAELPDLSGKPAAIKGLLGQKASVVLFWSTEGTSNLQELQDLTADVVEPYEHQNIRVVAINVQGTPVETEARAKLAGAKFPVLLDREGAYFSKVGKATLPRTYLVDGSGKVLWFDLGYSPETRRDLLQSLQALK